jgi:hypothetical protein
MTGRLIRTVRGYLLNQHLIKGVNIAGIFLQCWAAPMVSLPGGKPM